MPQSKVDEAYKVSSGEDEVETPATEETKEETPEVETPSEKPAEETTPEGDETPKEGETPSEGAPETPEETPKGESEDTPQEHRPTRSERRIKQLLEKQREGDEQTPQETPETPVVPAEESPREEVPVLPWDPQSGFDPEKLQTLIDQGVSRALETREQQAALRQRAEAWLADLESVKKANPELDETSPNYNKDLDEHLEFMLTNPDGSPRIDITVSQALSQIRGALHVAEEKGAHKASVKLAKQAEESALTPSSGSDSESEELDENEIASIRKTDPRRYNQLVKDGKI